MAYVRQRCQKDGTIRFYARYLGTDGRYHEEGGFRSRREAEKVATRREVGAARGDWASPTAGRKTFADYVAPYFHDQVTIDADRLIELRHAAFGTPVVNRQLPPDTVSFAELREAAPRDPVAERAFWRVQGMLPPTRRLHRPAGRAPHARGLGQSHRRSRGSTNSGAAIACGGRSSSESLGDGDDHQQTGR